MKTTNPAKVKTESFKPSKPSLAQSPRNQKLKRLIQKPQTPEKLKPSLTHQKPAIHENNFHLLLQSLESKTNTVLNQAVFPLAQIEQQDRSIQSEGVLENLENQQKVRNTVRNPIGGGFKT